MWLPKDERKLLRIYYEKIGEPGRREFIGEDDLIRTLSPKCAEQGIQGVPEYAKSKFRVAIANKVLSERKLIQYREASESIEVNLSMEGYVLGRKYASWFNRSGLWFAEYKDHWIWIIISFLGGVIGALLINWLSS